MRFKRSDFNVRTREDLFEGKLLQVGWLNRMRC